MKKSHLPQGHPIASYYILALASRIAAGGCQAKLDPSEDSVRDPLPCVFKPSGGLGPGYGCDLGFEWPDLRLLRRPNYLPYLGPGVLLLWLASFGLDLPREKSCF